MSAFWCLLVGFTGGVTSTLVTVSILLDRKQRKREQRSSKVMQCAYFWQGLRCQRSVSHSGRWHRSGRLSWTTDTPGCTLGYMKGYDR